MTRIRQGGITGQSNRLGLVMLVAFSFLTVYLLPQNALSVESSSNSTSTPASTVIPTSSNSSSIISSSTNDDTSIINHTNNMIHSIPNSTSPNSPAPVSNYNTSKTNTLVLDPTSNAISPNFITVNPGTSVTFTATISDVSSSPTTPTGTIFWGDGNAGGTFSPSSCSISSGICSVSYTLHSNSGNNIEITSTYAGDSSHSGSSGTSSLRVNLIHNTITNISPNSTAVNPGTSVTFTATISDVSSSPTTPTGTIFWGDGNAGGTFSPSSCSISSGICSVSYTLHSNSGNNIEITSTYAGDSSHSGSSGVSHLSMVILPPSLLLNTDQLYYAYGDVVSLSVNLPGQSLANIAIGVSNPNGDNIISRTVTTNENGTGSLQFKIPDTYQTGIYHNIVTALVGGKNYTNSTEFTVIKSHGISIDSIQITNQQGDPVSMLKTGQNGFVKVSISSGEKMPALLTVNLFDANQGSLGTTSIKSIVNPGSSQMTLSFFIPTNVQVGLANVFTDVYSDWPNNGGTPLTIESCLAAELQDPSSLPASYVPESPHSCSTSGASITNVSPAYMTNDNARVTLGISIQNDSMTFMSPTEAHLLALAYENETTSTNGKSVGTVTIDLSSMNKLNASSIISGNSTNGLTQFTTLVGPDLQNNPAAMKILQEIELSKRQVANIIGNETAAKLNQQLVLQQRQAASSKLAQDLKTLEQLNNATTPDAAYASFLTKVSDTRSQAVFQDEFNFMKQRVSVANAAMQKSLETGGSWEQAIADFNKYATISHVQMVSLNKDLNIKYGLADSRIQACFDSNGQLAVVNGLNPCVSNIENNSTGPSGISIISVQATDQQGNPVSLLKMGQTGYVKVVLVSNVHSQSLVTINLFDSNVSSLGTVSAQYNISPGQSEVVLPYYVPLKSGTGLANLYANIFTDWPNKGGISETNEQSYFVGLS